MDNLLYRQLHGLELEDARGDRGHLPGKSTLTSRLTPAAQVTVLRVSDPAVARAFGEGVSSGRRDGNGVAEGAELAVDRAASASGTGLPAPLQRQFEGSLGADLSSVRVHTGSASAEAAHAVGAKAYTVGQDIHFGAGMYQPDDPFGMHLLAHEVAHTVQQSGGATRRQHKLEVSTPHDGAEVEADRAADAMVTGASFAVGDATPTVAREPSGADHARAAAGNKSPASAEATTTSLKFSAKGVTGSIDWSKGVTGSLAYKVENDIYKPADVVDQFKIASYKEVAGLLGELKVGAEIKYGGELSASGSYESGKGGNVTLAGTGFIEASLSGQAKIAGYGGAVGHANMNAGAVAKITGTVRGAVVAKTPVFTLGPTGEPAGTAVLDADLTLETNATWGLEVGWYFNKKTGTMAALQLGSKPLGKLSNMGVSFALNADGTVTGPTWKWPPVYTPPTPLQLIEGVHRPLTAAEKAQFKQDDARQADERDGGSGSGAGVPPEAYDEEQEETGGAGQGGGAAPPATSDDPGGDPESIMYGSGPQTSG